MDDFNSTYMFKPGDILSLKKEPDNCYDDEAIVVYTKHGCKCGYVANSVHTVARGTYSAGRAYEIIKEDQKCVVCFITDEILIAKLAMC